MQESTTEHSMSIFFSKKEYEETTKKKFIGSGEDTPIFQDELNHLMEGKESNAAILN